MRKLEYKHWVIIIYVIVLFLDRLDITIVNIAFPTLANYFQVPIAKTSWISTSFLLALAIGIPLSDWLGDHFGLKRVFILATALFGLSSLLCAFAPNLTCMVILRYLQGIGGGIVVPIGMTMVYRNFDPSEYAIVTTWTFLPALLAPAMAPALGGIILTYFGWKWIFLIAAPICLIAISAALLKLKESQLNCTTRLDWLGFILMSISLSLFFYVLNLASLADLSSIFIILLILALALLSAFFWHINKTAQPLINLYFFKNKLFIKGSLLQFAFQTCHYGTFFLFGIYLQLFVKMSPIAAGTMIGMQALGSFCITRFSASLLNRFGAQLPITIGILGTMLLGFSILWITSPSQFVIGCLLLFLRGFFSGLCGAPIQTISLIDFNKTDIGKASALINIVRQLAISLGITIFSLAIDYNLNSADQQAITTHAFYYIPFAIIPISGILGLLLAASAKQAGKQLSI